MAFRQPLSRYGQCDSYFFKTQGANNYAARTEEREHTQAITRMQQRALAEELSRITVDEYQQDIVEHMEYMELQTMPNVDSIDIQTEIQWSMRLYLLDFLVEVHATFQLLPKTLFLAVNILDRYCSRRFVYKRHYQLVGYAALLIAAKYGDNNHVPSIWELELMCRSLYDDEMFIQMERRVLQTLNWILGHPTVDAFLQVTLAEQPFNPEVEHMSLYIAEIALFHQEFVSTRPWILARSSLALARCILSRNDQKLSTWTATYDTQTVKSLLSHLYHPSQVLTRKYSSMHLSNVSTTVDELLQRQVLNIREDAGLEMPELMSDACGSPISREPHYSTAVMQHGCLTPPITPGNEQFLAISCPTPPTTYPNTPTSERPANMHHA